MKLEFQPNGITLEEIANITHGSIPEQLGNRIRGISTDSRTMNSGELYIAIKGERFDGHAFIKDALNSGASGILAEYVPDGISNERIVLVKNSVAALGDLAAAYKEGIDPVTVAVTGSVGKTTTKQFLASVIGASMPTHSTQMNQNNEIGLPKTLLNLRDEHKALVVEMAMDHHGDINYLTNIAKPDIAIITCIGNSHIENLGSKEAIRDEKLSITNGLKTGGKLILNGDDPYLANIKDAVYVGENPSCDYVITNVRLRTSSITYDLKCPDKIMYDLYVCVPGKHNAFDSALAVCAADLLGIDEHLIRLGLMSFRNTEMRQQFEEVDKYTFIVDCYNAAPESIKASLGVLKASAIDHDSRAIAVLGEMRELGEYSSQLHRCVGTDVAAIGADKLFTFGNDANSYAVGAIEGGLDESKIFSFPDLDSPELLAHELYENMLPGDIILFKASRAVKLERVIDLLKKEIFNNVGN